MKKRSRYNQTIFNTCVWGYGSIDNIALFVFDNGLKFDGSIEQGTEVVFDDEIGNDEVKEYIERNSLIPVNKAKLRRFYYTRFDGVNEYVNLGNDNSLNFERTDPFSLSIWFKNTELNASQVLLIKRENAPSPPKGYSFSFDASNKLTFILSHSQVSASFPVANRIFVETSSSVLSTTNMWHHLAVTYDGSVDASGVKIYVDGVNQALTTLTNNLTLTTQHSDNAEIAAFSYSSAYTEGDFDEVSIFGSELTTANILDIYNRGRKDPTLTDFVSIISHWKMDAINPIDEIGSNNGTGVNLDETNIIEWT